MIFYRRILVPALALACRHKALWPMGLAIAFLGTLGETIIFSRSVDFGAPGIGSLWRGLRTSGVLSLQGFFAVVQHLREDPLDGLWRVVILAGIGVVLAGLVWVALVAQGALVHAVAMVGAGRRADAAASWRHGRRKFWPLLGCAVLVKGTIGALFFVLTLMVGMPGLVFGAAFVATSCLVLWLAVLWKYAVAALVLEDRRIWTALAQARRLLGRRWPQSVVLAGGLFLGTLAAAAVMLVAVFLVSIPFDLLLGTAVLLHFATGGLVYFLLRWMTLAGLVALAAVLVTAVHWSAWTLAYVEAATGKFPNPKA